jgi:microcystin-dependent protein
MANVNYAQTKYNWDGQYLTGLQGLSTGTIVPWSTSTAPTGFLKCDGSAVSRTTYAALFAVVSTTYGAGDGSTTFNVPDLQDRTAIGASVANSKSLAQTGGANTVTPTGNISGSTGSTTLQTNQIASHSHQVTGNVMGCGTSMGFNVSASGLGTTQVNSASTGGGQSHTHNLSANFVGSANSVLQPYLVLIYIIKT